MSEEVADINAWKKIGEDSRIAYNKKIREQFLRYCKEKRKPTEDQQPFPITKKFQRQLDEEIRFLKLDKNKKGEFKRKRKPKEITIEELRDILFSKDQIDWEKGIRNKHPGHIQPKSNKNDLLTGEERVKQFNHEQLNKKINLKNAEIEQEKKTTLLRKIEKYIAKHKNNDEEERNLLIFLHDLADSLSSSELKSEFESIKQDMKNQEKTDKAKTKKFWEDIERLKIPYQYIGHFQRSKLLLRCVNCNKYIYEVWGKRCCGQRMIPWQH